MMDISDTAKATQCAAILRALHEGPLSTIEARDRLGIQHVSGRVMELRRQGHAIATRRHNCVDSQGRPHHGTALYVLNSEAAP